MRFPTLALLSPARVAGVLMALMLVSGSALAAQAPLRLAVAANFRATLEALVQQWDPAHQHAVRLISGSSGQLYAQILHGAPFDVFFSADHERPQRLVAQGVADAASLADYAQGVLVLVGKTQQSSWPKALRQAGGRIALANPRTAPYGQAAVQVLQKHALVEELQDRLIYPESVQQVLHYLLSGQVAIGFVSAAQLAQLPDSFQTYRVPGSAHAQIRQAMVMPKAGQRPDLARQLLEFVLSPAGQDVIEAAAYQRVDQ